jgi:hypothetical protein
MFMIVAKRPADPDRRIGARRFVGEIDGYMRTSDAQTRYELDNRGGVRFRVDGFMTTRVAARSPGGRRGA